VVIPKTNVTADQLRRWHQTRKESVWRKPAGDIHLELHTRLTANRHLLPGMNVHTAQQRVEVVPGSALPTLAVEEMFAYLCVHGSSSAWFRLKWLADFAGLIKNCSSSEITRLFKRSQELGAGRSAAQALLLAQAMFETAIDRSLADELAGDWRNRWLARMAWRQMAQVREPTDARFGTSTIHVTQFLLLPGLCFKFEELRRQLGDAVGNRI
jgi:hypothetical protein